MLELNEVQLFKGDPENIWGEQIKQPENILSMEVTEIMNGDLTLSMVCAISDFNIKDTFNKLGYKAEINNYTASRIN